jgi:hypothetical protein
MSERYVCDYVKGAVTQSLNTPMKDKRYMHDYWRVVDLKKQDVMARCDSEEKAKLIASRMNYAIALQPDLVE